jgi:hypothetical protein
MSSVKKAAIDGFNEFIKSQKALKDDAIVTVAGTLFDDKFEELYDGKTLALNDVPEMTDKVFIPRGMTALCDAIGKSANAYKASKQTHDKILVVIVTDGGENASIEFTKQDVADLIKYQKTQGWQFIFLCSTEDALTVGDQLNISKGNVFKFENSSLGNSVMYSKVSAAAGKYRGMSKSVSLTSSDALLEENEQQ